MMRLKYAKLITILVFLVNVILLYYTWKWFLTNETNGITGDTHAIITNEKFKQNERLQSTNKHIKRAITIIFRDFYHFDNDLEHSIDSILNLIPNIQILVIYDDEPYPPLTFIANFTTIHTNVKFINLKFDVRKSEMELSPIHQIRTKYVLFVPDSFRFGGRAIIQKMLKEIEKEPLKLIELDTQNPINIAPYELAADITLSSDQKRAANNAKDMADKFKVNGKVFNRKVAIIPFASNAKTMGNCCSIDLDFANWTMEYSVKNDTNDCDMYLQKHAILVDTNLLRSLPNPLANPFPEMFYIQAKLAKAHLQMLTAGSLQDGKRLFTAFHNKQRKKDIRKQMFKEMYKKLDVKKVIRKFAGKSAAKIEKFRKQQKGSKSQIANNRISGDSIILSNTSLPLLTTIEYFGCERNTKSCIYEKSGIIYNHKPFFLYLQRNTPPCCMEKLKIVFGHVVEELEAVGIRYWLDNFALRMAVEVNQLALDAYEIDISFNAFDLERSQYLKKAQARPIIDTAGFYWIKATDGHYFHVQYSKQNQIGINLLPFDISGNLVRANGFYGWKATEFSAEFLHPMSTVLFLNKNVMCPNNVREFLDLKNLN